LVAVIAINLAARETNGITSYSTMHILSCHTNVPEKEVPENIETT
jgi:hypothetical protein